MDELQLYRTKLGQTVFSQPTSNLVVVIVAVKLLVLVFITRKMAFFSKHGPMIACIFCKPTGVAAFVAVKLLVMVTVFITRTVVFLATRMTVTLTVLRANSRSEIGKGK